MRDVGNYLKETPPNSHFSLGSPSTPRARKSRHPCVGWDLLMLTLAGILNTHYIFFMLATDLLDFIRYVQ